MAALNMAGRPMSEVNAEIASRKQERDRKAKYSKLGGWETSDLERDIAGLFNKDSFKQLFPAHLIPSKGLSGPCLYEILKIAEDVAASGDALMVTSVVEAAVRIRVAQPTSKELPKSSLITHQDLTKAFSFFETYKEENGEPFTNRSRLFSGGAKYKGQMGMATFTIYHEKIGNSTKGKKKPIKANETKSKSKITKGKSRVTKSAVGKKGGNPSKKPELTMTKEARILASANQPEAFKQAHKSKEMDFGW